MTSRDLAAGLAVAVPLAAASTLVAGRGVDPVLVAADLAVGFLFVAAGALASQRRPASRSGLLMVATGLAWFIGGLVPIAVYLHRATLAHLLVAYPSGRLDGRFRLAVVGLAYAYAPLAAAVRGDAATIGFTVMLAAAVGVGALRARGAVRPARLSAFTAAVAFAGILVAGMVVRVDGAVVDLRLPLAYRAVLCAIAVGIVVDLLWAGWSPRVVTQLVVDLGAGGRGTSLREQLARALGDPSLTIGYPAPGAGSRLVDEAGRDVALPPPGSGRRATPLPLHDGTSGVVVHDDAILDDPALVETVAAAAGIAASNAQLAADVRRSASETAASRRRLVHATDHERRRLQRTLESRVDPRLERVRQLVSAVPATSPAAAARAAVVTAELDAALRQLRDFSRGVDPVALSPEGLAGAVTELAERSAIPVTVRADAEVFPPVVESTAYFVCSEALANVAKHAEASHARVELTARDGALVVSVTDDGVGGARMDGGSGLRGLADRVEALGGRLRVESAPGSGTSLVATLPAGGGRP